MSLVRPIVDTLITAPPRCGGRGSSVVACQARYSTDIPRAERQHRGGDASERTRYPQDILQPTRIRQLISTADKPPASFALAALHALAAFSQPITHCWADDWCFEITTEHSASKALLPPTVRSRHHSPPALAIRTSQALSATVRAQRDISPASPRLHPPTAE